MSMSDLAIRYGEGRRPVQLAENVLGARMQTLGEEHPDALTSMSMLADQYGELDRMQEAVQLDKKVLKAGG
jgi:hypothetical protein